MTQAIANIGENAYKRRADLVLRTTKPALTSPTLQEVKMAAPTTARLHLLFNYDPVSGVLIWRERSPSDFKTLLAYESFVANRMGQPAGGIDAQGYRRVTIGNSLFLQHKLIWQMAFDEVPKYPDSEIDHINGDRADNRLSNLRKVTKSDNQRNGSLRRNNASGVNGVNWVASKQRWLARIWDGPHHRYLGQFKNLEDARQARVRAERELEYHPGHGKEPRCAILSDS
jgi:hypothetical protein